MTTVDLTLTDMAHGGAALGRDETNRVVFVPLAIPGERVVAEIVQEHRNYAHARLIKVLEPAPERVEAPCPYYGSCGGCHFQHISYGAQLRLKENVVRDQLSRIGGVTDAVVHRTLANNEPWYYSVDVHLSPTAEGGLGFWSPREGRVIAIETCRVIRPPLLELIQDIDLALPELRSLRLGIGDDGATLAVLETENGEPPALHVDFPISAALLLPDGTVVNLVGDNYLVHKVRGRDFRVSAGCFFHPNPEAAGLLAGVVVDYAALTGLETVLELYSGVGLLTAFLAPAAAELLAVELNPSAIADSATNLAECHNVSLYEGPVEEIVPLLELAPDVVVCDPPPAGLSTAIVDEIVRLRPKRLVYVSSDVATMARDSRRLSTAGYQLAEIQPVDMVPQTFMIHTVSLWLPEE